MADRRPRRFRWLRSAALIGLGAIAVVAAALWLLLPTIVGRLVTERLAEMGVPAPRLVVSQVGYGRVILAGVAAGTEDELTAREIAVEYRLPELFDGTIDGITISGPTLRASLGPDGLSLGSLDPLLAGNRDGEPPSIPPVRIEDATIDLATVIGRVTLAGGGLVAQAETGVGADLDLTAEAPQGTARFALELRIAGSLVDARLRLAEGRIALPELISASAAGEITARLADGDLAVLDGRLAIGELAIVDPRVAALGPLAGSMTFARTPDRWRVSAVLADRTRSLDLDLRLTAAELGFDAPVTVALDLEATAAAPVWPYLGLRSLSGGRASARLVGEAIPSRLFESIGTGVAPEAAGSITLNLEDVPLDGTVRSVSATGGFDFGMASGALRLTAAAPVLAEVQLDPAMLEAAGLPAPAIGLLARPLAVTVELARPMQVQRRGNGPAIDAEGAIAIDLPDGHRLLDAAGTTQIAVGDTGSLAVQLAALSARFDLPGIAGIPPGIVTADGSASIADGSASATVTLTGSAPEMEVGGLRARRLKLDLPLAVEYGNGRLTARLTGRGSLSAARLGGLTPLKLDGPVQLPFIPGDIPSLIMDLANLDLPLASIDLMTGPLHLAGTTDTEHGPIAGDLSWPGLHMRAALGAAGWSGEITAQRGTLHVPTYKLEASGFDLSAGIPTEGAPRLSLTAALTHRGEPALVVPLSASLVARLVEGGWSFTGHAADAFDRISVDIEGRHDLARAAGTATLRVAPIEFAPNVRQPADLAPYLAGVAEDVSGTIALAGDLSWTAGRIGSDLKLLLRDVSATTEIGTIARLNGVIAVDGLSPFSTPPGQRVAVAAIDAGLPLTDGLLTFRVAPGPKLEIADGRLHLAGGTVVLQPMVFDPTGDSNAAVLAVSGVELGELLALAQLDGLSGRGKLTGQIPVRLERSDLVIDGGRLEAEAPGSLSYAPLAPPVALQGQGETVSLALSALTDFQYQQLRLTVDRQAGGEMFVGMHVRGSNPDFYDGYPVEFNLTVSGALDRVLRQSLAGYRIPDAIEERLEEFAQ